MPWHFQLPISTWTLRRSPKCNAFRSVFSVASLNSTIYFKCYLCTQILLCTVRSNERCRDVAFDWHRKLWIMCMRTRNSYTLITRCRKKALIIWFPRKIIWCAPKWNKMKFQKKISFNMRVICVWHTKVTNTKWHLRKNGEKNHHRWDHFSKVTDSEHIDSF